MAEPITTTTTSPKGEIYAKAPEGQATTTSTIAPKPSTAVEEAKISETALTSGGQRDINLMWETAQSKIAVRSVTVGLGLNVAVVLIALVMSFLGVEVNVNQLAIISVCLQFINLTVGIIIGFYFSRTNHTKVGGVGGGDVKER